MADLPEERVRQRLIQTMTGPLGYPKGLIVVEKSLSQLPHLHLPKTKLPNRRIDLLCFGRDIHPQHSLYPLLLVECKAVPLTSKVINQVVGYNRYVGAYYVAIVNQDQIQTGCFDLKQKAYAFIDHLPSYQELISCLPIKS